MIAPGQVAAITEGAVLLGAVGVALVLIGLPAILGARSAPPAEPVETATTTDLLRVARAAGVVPE